MIYINKILCYGTTTLLLERQSWSPELLLSQLFHSYIPSLKNPTSLDPTGCPANTLWSQVVTVGGRIKKLICCSWHCFWCSPRFTPGASPMMALLNSHHPVPSHSIQTTLLSTIPSVHALTTQFFKLILQPSPHVKSNRALKLHFKKCCHMLITRELSLHLHSTSEMTHHYKLTE